MICPIVSIIFSAVLVRFGPFYDCVLGRSARIGAFSPVVVSFDRVWRSFAPFRLHFGEFWSYWYVWVPFRLVLVCCSSISARCGFAQFGALWRGLTAI